MSYAILSFSFVIHLYSVDDVLNGVLNSHKPSS